MRQENSFDNEARTPENLKRFIGAAKTAGLQPVIPVDIDTLAQPERIEQWHCEKGMLAFGLRGADTMAYRDNPALLQRAEAGVRMRFLPTGAVVQTPECTAATENPVSK